MEDILLSQDVPWTQLVLWPVLISVGLFVLLGYVATLEKQPPHEYFPITPGETVNSSPYLIAMSEQAMQLGYVGGEMGKHPKGKRFASAWFSPDRRKLLLIAGGKVGLGGVRRTMLISPLPNGDFLVTTDDVGDVDSTGIQNQKVVLYADAYELDREHARRMAKFTERGDGPTAFTQDSPLEAFAAFQQKEVSLLLERGHARHVDETRTYWRYKLPAAVRAMAKALNPWVLLRNSVGVRNRMHRPGDRYYKPRIKDVIPTARPMVADDAVAAIVEAHPNIAWDASPVTLELRSRYVAVFDPSMLDVLHDEEVSRDTDAEALAAAAQRLAAREPAFACIPIIPFAPGPHTFDPGLLQPIDGAAHDAVDTVAVDSGALIIVDVAVLPRIAALMDWHRYNDMLGPESDQVIEQLMEQLGGPVFGLVHGDAERTFAGDGKYRVATTAICPT